MTISDIIKELEKKFPKNFAESWDNVGLLVGDRKQDIKKIIVTLDATESVIDMAIERNADLIISHHPLIFSPIKHIDFSELIGRKIMKLIKNNISLYSLHTNIDSAPEGLNWFLGECLGFESGKILEENSFQESSYGIGRVYKLDRNMSVLEIGELIKEKLKLEKIIVSSKNIELKSIKKIAIINGSGMGYWRKAKKLGADLVLTGDVKYHEAIDAVENGISVIDIGHYESEIIFGELIKENLQSKFEVEIEILNDEPIFKDI
ncbi:MAG: Nif3-like dinuclear metal center hexameric protein [Cetobacterium sp.]|uniref:Nif3-like dinuclear metal center hexameric protein n=1 Tax=Cetobacterium sp. TaxID=2071632 RepID=UPI002FC9A696